MYHYLSSYYSISSQLLYQKAYKVSLLCHPPPQIQFVNITLKLQIGMKSISERISEITHLSRLGREFNPLIQNCHVCPQQKCLESENCVCVCVHTHTCIFIYICIFLRKWEKKVTAAIMHRKGGYSE